MIYGTKLYGYNSSGIGVRAYVLDSGVYSAHSEFEGRVEQGANFTHDPQATNTPPPGSQEEPGIAEDGWLPTNPCGGWGAVDNTDGGHGTAVASVLGGKTAGVAKHVTIIPVKVTNCNGQTSKLAMARGMDWIQLDMQNYSGSRAVVNISLALVFFDGNGHENHLCEDSHTPPVGFTNCVSALENEINQLLLRNIVVVVGAGNQGTEASCGTSPARMGFRVNVANTANRPITVGGTMYTGAYVDERWTCARQPG